VQITAGVPSGLKIDVEGDACPIVTVTQIDDQGVMNPYAENRIHHHIDGPARILSLESGNPVNTESNYGKTSRAAFFGLARAFLQVVEDGRISVVVGAICGEKQLMTSNRVSIAVQTIKIRQAARQYDLKVLYSTDGAKPATEYKSP